MLFSSSIQSRALGIIRSHVLSVLKGASSQVMFFCYAFLMYYGSRREKDIKRIFFPCIFRCKLLSVAVFQARLLFQKELKHLLYMFALRLLLVRYISVWLCSYFYFCFFIIHLFLFSFFSLFCSFVCMWVGRWCCENMRNHTRNFSEICNRNFVGCYWTE